MEVCLREHAEYLLEVNLPFHRLSNWGILQNHGLLLLGLYFGENGWIQEAVRRLDEESHLQVFRDGTQWEQSPMYHGEVLYCLLDSLLHLKRFDRPAPRRLWEKVRKMVYALAAWCKPDGHMPCHGDSDDIDARDLIAEGAVLFKDGRLKFLAHEVLLEDNLWNFLFFTGYLKKVREHMQADTVYITLAIPNAEVKYIYRNTIMEWFDGQIRLKDFSALYKALLNKDIALMRKRTFKKSDGDGQFL